MPNATTVLRRIGVAAIATATGLALAACNGPTSNSPPASSPGSSSPPASADAQMSHNQQDVMFAQMMIPHHQQAISMAETEIAKGQADQVKSLANAIKDAQGPEINRMRGWLTTWMVASESGQMHHGGGMMSPGQMNEFQQASGVPLDRMFLQMMIAHHEGAVDMARTEQQQGQSRQARQLAGSIISSQQAEITQMKQMLTAH